ncbi:MAG TPA: transporter substrate-binding domain-containing protein [Gammaproteobacteria bacterium]|nr:transporter substrate-binding domain-containing protein [Gammaproteobacteria bacterium]
MLNITIKQHCHVLSKGKDVLSKRIISKSLLSFLSLLLFPLLIHANTSLTITSGRGEPFVNAEQNGFYDLIVKNMFQRIGIEAKTVLLPSERSLISANTGVDDGNIARIKGVEKKYTDLVRVPEKIIDFDFVVFTKNREFKVEGWKSLAPFNVAFINGWKAFEKKVIYYKTLVKPRDSVQLFELLRNDRVDVALYDLWSGVWWTRHHSDEIRYLQPPVASYQLYLYVNKKHRGLVPELSIALKSMKKDGTYKKIYEQTLTRLLN